MTIMPSPAAVCGEKSDINALRPLRRRAFAIAPRVKDRSGARLVFGRPSVPTTWQSPAAVSNGIAQATLLGEGFVVIAGLQLRMSPTVLTPTIFGWDHWTNATTWNLWVTGTRKVGYLGTISKWISRLIRRFSTIEVE